MLNFIALALVFMVYVNNSGLLMVERKNEKKYHEQ